MAYELRLLWQPRLLRHMSRLYSSLIRDDFLWGKALLKDFRNPQEIIMGSQHPSPHVKPLCNFEPQKKKQKSSHRVMPKVLVLKAQGRHVM